MPSEFSKTALINMIVILFMSTKLASPELLSVTVFENKGYEVTICL